MNDQPYKELVAKQNSDADIIFTVISTSDFDDFEQAERVVVMLYVTDMSFSRAGISLALKRLEKFYELRKSSRIAEVRHKVID